MNKARAIELLLGVFIAGCLGAFLGHWLAVKITGVTSAPPAPPPAWVTTTVSPVHLGEQRGALLIDPSQGSYFSLIAASDLVIGFDREKFQDGQAVFLFVTNKENFEIHFAVDKWFSSQPVSATRGELLQFYFLNNGGTVFGDYAARIK